MKVIAITETHYFPVNITIPLEVGTAKIEVTDKIYSSYTTVIEVCETVEAAEATIKKRRAHIVEHFGEKALDDENIKDKHSFFTYGTKTLDTKR